MLAKIKSVAFIGIDAFDVTVEVNVSSKGLPSFDIVGLPNKSIEESKHRIRSAFINSGFDFPNKKITVNLAPADIHKLGSGYDLPIAVAIFCATLGICIQPVNYFFGELSLDGTICSTRGEYLVVDYVNHSRARIFLGMLQGNEYALFNNCHIYNFPNLAALFKEIKSGLITNNLPNYLWKNKPFDVDSSICASLPPLVFGQQEAKRVLQITAAGKHNLLLIGSPGVGKSMLAKSLPYLIPPLADTNALEVHKLYSFAGISAPEYRQAPFRAPHHTISYSGMLGGGTEPLPGEVSLSHNGVLFLDEFCEISRNVVEALRQPLQEGYIQISRNNYTYKFPSRFQLVAATNPCPCGYFGHPLRICTCTDSNKARYAQKLSGPLLDRIDLCVRMFPEPSFVENLSSNDEINIDWAQARSKVALACQFASSLPQNTNSFNRLTKNAKKILNDAYNKFALSPRSYTKLIGVASTLANLECKNDVSDDNVAEALQYRPM